MNRISFGLFSAVVALAAVAFCAGRSEANTAADKGAGCAAEAKCCPAPCIDYRYRRPCRKVCCECAPPQKLTLCVKDPCCCTSAGVKIPVCIPSCCKGEPCVTDRCGLLGRGVVTYEWCCGYKLTVAFKKCGDITVTYYGS